MMLLDEKGLAPEPGAVKMEVPVRSILMGIPVEKAANRAAMSNVHSLNFFISYERDQQDYRL